MLAVLDKNPRLQQVLLVLLAAAATISVVYNVNRGLNDELAGFDFQWDVARIIVLRQNPYEMFLNRQPAPTDGILADNLQPNQVPSAVALIIPYAFLDWPMARLLWIFSNLVFSAGWVAALLMLYKQRVEPKQFLLWLSLLCITLYWGAIIWVGQHTLFSLFFFTLSLLCLQRRQTLRAGIFIALSLFKYHLVLPLLFIYLYKRAYWSLVIAVGIHGVLHLAVSAWLNVNPVTLLLQSLRAPNGLLDQGHYHIFALVLRAAQRFGMGDNLLLPGIVSVALITVTFLLTLYVARKPDAEREIRLFILLILVALVWVYHRSYDWVAYFFILYFVLNGLVSGKWFPRWLLFICLMELYLPLIIPPDNEAIIRLTYWPRAAFHYGTMLYLFVNLVRQQRPARVASTRLPQKEPTTA